MFSVCRLWPPCAAPRERLLFICNSKRIRLLISCRTLVQCISFQGSDCATLCRCAVPSCGAIAIRSSCDATAASQCAHGHCRAMKCKLRKSQTLQSYRLKVRLGKTSHNIQHTTIHPAIGANKHRTHTIHNTHHTVHNTQHTRAQHTRQTQHTQHGVAMELQWSCNKLSTQLQLRCN